MLKDRRRARPECLRADDELKDTYHAIYTSSAFLLYISFITLYFICRERKQDRILNFSTINY
ncbi:hypothetical protein Mapa_000420 [Marchantia paleacea]|nr:hypothetical protein Mapa_000420 [Marchantia paleacea]